MYYVLYTVCLTVYGVCTLSKLDCCIIDITLTPPTPPPPPPPHHPPPPPPHLHNSVKREEEEEATLRRSYKPLHSRRRSCGKIDYFSKLRT